MYICSLSDLIVVLVVYSFERNPSSDLFILKCKHHHHNSNGTLLNHWYSAYMKKFMVILFKVFSFRPQFGTTTG